MAEGNAHPALRMTPSRPRLVLGAGILLVLAVVVVGLAVQGVYTLPGRVTLLAIALGAGLLARRVWRAGQVSLVLEDDTLREDGPGGRVLARVGDIRAVERGAFAFKPSNGFLLKLHEPGPAVWVPGVWWRSRRHVGVGGLLPAHQTRLVSEAIAMQLAGQSFPPTPP